jgi:hypothetical protein
VLTGAADAGAPTNERAIRDKKPMIAASIRVLIIRISFRESPGVTTQVHFGVA